MSHFTVLVLAKPGEDIERLLAPFHEFECTGVDNEFVVTLDQTAKLREEYDTDSTYADNQSYREKRTFQKFLSEYHSYTKVNFGEQPDLNNDHKYSYFTVNEDEEVTGVYRRTNPNSKWDYWRIGGRWGGALKLKAEYADKEIDSIVRPENGWDSPKDIPDGVADAAPKFAIDIEGQREEARLAAGKRFDEALAKMGNLDFKSWDEVWNDETIPDHDAKRYFYNNQAQVAAYYDGVEGTARIFGERPDSFKIGREAYVNNAGYSAISGYAFLSSETGWIAKGEMGWWGMSSGESAEKTDDYLRVVNEIIDKAPDDAVLAIVDCHV